MQCNYRFFIMFITTSTILCIYVFVFSLINIIKKEGSVWKVMKEDILSDILMAYCFVAVWFVGGLTVFHFYLICTNQTTYENFRYRYDKKENPYNEGMKKNLREMFFSKIPNSISRFRSFVEEEHMMVASVSLNRGEAIISPEEKIDIEMGTRRAESGVSLPEILRNLDYDDLEDDEKTAEGEEGRSVFDPPLHVEQELNQSVQSSTGGDGVTKLIQSSSIGDGVRMSIQKSSFVEGAGESDQRYMAVNVTKTDR
ncbi:hypothetical protein F2P56_007442 [Juglans regia]|uniref:S-acyltransferase n=1 Tax=Juglans regia TaxID=51240 RepID=A0A833Y3J1_JUGRE|nr:hypothetical protein F2P56_007442 [Juglans regia]